MTRATILRPLILSLSALAVTGCAWLGDAVGSGKHPPDEFVVVNQRPLVVPPDFQLRPPRPGVPSPQNIEPSAQVVNALFPNVTSVPPNPSAGELALLGNISGGNADIRPQVDGNTEVVQKGLLLGELLAMEPRRLESDGARIERIGSDPR